MVYTDKIMLKGSENCENSKNGQPAVLGWLYTDIFRV